MKLKNMFGLQNLSMTLLAAFALAFSGGFIRVSAHGGEDHGAAKPKTETSDKGAASHTTRVGDLEVMLKHERLIPDADNMARLFVTKYETNEAFADIAPAIEIEAANGAVTQATIEKTDAAGSFSVKLPALPEGIYLIRANIKHGGETDTATFSGVEITRQAAADAGSSSWTQTALMIMLFLVALALFGGLAYFARRVFTNKPIREETVSV